MIYPFNPGHFTPGRLFKAYEVRRELTDVNEAGRIVQKERRLKDTAKVIGAIAAASPQEIETFSRLEHPISHVFVTRNAKTRLKPGDVLLRDGREFRVTRNHGPGEVGLWEVYYLLEEKHGRD